MDKEKGTYQVLVVEDNPGDYLLIEDYLGEEMHTSGIKQAKYFKDACAVMAQKNNSIDAILLDLTLPDKQGEELITEMMAVASDTPIIILTGYSDVKFAIRALTLGASDYLLKDSLNSTVLYKSIVYNIERNKNIVRIKESEQRYSDLFHLSPQPMWVYDLETLRFLDVNEAAIAHYGYSFDEFLNMTIADIRPAAEIPLMQEDVERSRMVDKRYARGIFKHRLKSGAIIAVEIKSNIIKYNGRKAEIVLATDITERNKYMETIELQNEKLREIAWTQSHIVRAPLARIMGLVDLMLDGSTSNQEKEMMLQYVMQSANELDGIIQEIINKSHQSLIT